MGPREERRPAAVTRLLDGYRDWLAVHRRSTRTVESYVAWVARYLAYLGGRGPREAGEAGINAFLTSLARERLSASTQNQARAALVCLLRDHLGVMLDSRDVILRARRPVHVPTVLTRDEVFATLSRLPRALKLPAGLLYGSGLRLNECLRLRVKDVDAGRRSLTVRAGKGDKDRVTVVPDLLLPALERHLARRREEWERDLAGGVAGCTLPPGVVRKRPGAARTWE